MIPVRGYKRQRFRITLEGFTRFVANDLEAGDVTLIMPADFIKDDKFTKELQLGGMPLDSVEWLPDPAKRGDILTVDSPEPPIGSVVLTTYPDGVAYPATRTPSGWKTHYFESVSWLNIVRITHTTCELIHVGRGY